MRTFKNIALRVLTLIVLFSTLCVQSSRALSNDDYFTVVLFGDPEVGLTDREGNNATQANLTRWAEGIVNMHQNTNGYFNFQSQPAGFVPKADLVICMGDMDGDSETEGKAIKAVFKKFTDADIPFITMIGNHDVTPDRWNNGQVGATTYAGHKANKFAFDLVTSYLNTAKGNGIENVKRFESEYGVNQAKPFTFTFRGVRFYIGQTYWFQKTYDNNTPLLGTGTPPTTYIPYDVVDELDAFVQANASTPSVWVQHYPINAADRWWNDTNENGGYITPANEDADMKTAAQKRERYKQIIAKSSNPWHFSGHQHSAYKSNYTTNGKSFTDHVAPYFATNGSAYIALCKRGEGVLEVRQVCFDPSYQTASVQNIGQLSNDKAYTIRTANGILCYRSTGQQVANAASGISGTCDSNDTNNHWAIVTQNGLNYLYSIGAGKFARKPANSTNSNATVLELVDTPDANCLVTIEPNASNNDYPWLIKFGGVILNVSPGYTDKNGIWMGGWSTIDSGNQYAISEAGDFTGIQDVKESLAEAGLDDVVTAGNLTTGWYQLWSDVTTVMRDPKLITSVDQLSSPASAPGDEGVLSYLIDDNTGTYWHSNWAGGNLTFDSDAQRQHYVQFDLRDAYQELTFAYCCRADGGSDRPTAFAVTASNDANGTFTQVATISNVGTTANQMQYFHLQLSAKYQYIRLRATDTHNGKHGYWHASEMQFYPGAIKLKLITSVDQMSSPKSDNHGNEGNLASLIDNNASTYWHSDWSNSVTFGSEAQMQHYVQFDLGSAYQDLTLCYRSRDAANDQPTAFAVTASNSADGAYTQVATITGIGTDPIEDQYFHFDMGAAYRYIRLRATATSGSDRGYWHAAEMQFYPGEFRTEHVQAYYKTLNISEAPSVGGSFYDMASAPNGTDPNTLFYLERVGNGQVKFHLPTGYSVGTNCSRTNSAVDNVITVTAPDADPSLLRLKNDANHGDRYWVSRSDAAYADGLIIKANKAPMYWKLRNVSDKMIDYDVWTIVPKVAGNSVPTVHYTAEGYTGVSEFTTGGMLIVPKGTVLSVEDFTVDEEGSTVRIDDGNKQIVVVSKVYRLGDRITNPNQIRNGGKYMILNAASKTGNGFFCKWVKNNNGNFALESNGTPAALQLAPLDAEVYADKIWTFTTTNSGYTISNTANGTKTQNISISDFATAVSKGGLNSGITDQRLYFEDMGDGIRCYTTCQTGDGFWIIDTGGSGNSKYFNGGGNASFALWAQGYPYSIFQVEEVTSFDVNYGVSTNAKGFMSRDNNRRTEWVSLKVGDGEPVKIENLQQKANANNEYRPMYFNRTGVKFVCQTGAQLTAAVGVGDMNSMQAMFFIDEDGDGFEDGINAVDNSQHKVLPGHDLKTHSGYRYGTSDTWWNSVGASVNASNLVMPAFTAPSKPGVYRVRYVVTLNSVDPAGYTNIHTDGGIIVDATLEVQAADVYNLTLADAASIRTDVLGQRGLGYPRTESEAYAKLDAALSAIEHRNEASALIHIENNQQLSKLGNGSRIALTCRDNSGGGGYYFNGAATKTAPANYSAANNIFVMEQSTNGYKLKRAGNGQYVAHGGGYQGNIITQSTNPEDATEFTLAFAKAGWDGNKMDGTDEYMTVRVTAYGENTFLNTQGSGSTPKYHNGTGGYSVWYLYEQPSDAQLLSDLKTALTEYYRCTDVELPEDGHSYSVQYVDLGMANNTFLLVANDDEEGTVRMVGSNVKYYNGTAFSNGYSPLDNNLKIAKCGYDAAKFGCLKAGDNDMAMRWTEIESPSVVEPTYQVNNNGTIQMTIPGVSSTIVAVYANDVEVTSEASVTAGTNTTVLLPSKPNRTWFTVLVADQSGVRRFQYQILNFQQVTIEFINDVTNGSETFTNKRVSIGSTMAELLAELHPKCVVTTSTHEEIEDGVLTGYVVHYEPYYPVEGLDNNSHAERYTESVSLAVGTAPAVTIATGQTAASPIYIDKRSETIVCSKGQTLQPAVNFHGNAMHAYVYVDANHDGFIASASDIQGNVLKTGNNIDLRSFSYYNGYGSNGATQEPSVGVTMPTFTAPSVPGTYVMRYKVDWDNIDPDGAESIASNGGIIVDVTLEVRDYNVKVNHRYDGEIKETIYEYVNADDASAWSPRRVMAPAGYAATGGWQTFDIVAAGLNGKTLDIYYTYSDANMPFAFTTMDTDGNVTAAHYYTMTVHGKNAFFQPNSNNGTATNQIKLTATERTRDINDYFYFVGNNTEGFTLHSTAVSPALSFDVRDKKFTVAANKYRLLDTFDGTTHKYAVREAGSQAVMNDEDGAGNLGVWLTPSSVAHDYVLFTFAAADAATVAAAIAAVPWPESGKYYYVKSGMTFTTGTKALSVNDSNAPRWDTVDDGDLHFMWKATGTGGGKYTFRNVNNNRYLKTIGETSTDAANAYLIYMGEYSNGHQFLIITSAEQAIHAGGHSGGAGNNGNIVAYYGSANAASSWKFEEVDDDAMRTGLANKVAEIEGKVGTGLGKYTLVDVDDYDDQMLNAKELLTDDTSELDDVLDAIKALSGWTFELNMPQAGQFVRMQNVATPANYADNYVNSVTTTGASTIFYYTTDNGRKVLIGYDNGKCPTQQGSAGDTNETHLLADNTMEYTFAEASNNTGAGQYYVKWGARYIFGKNAGGLDGGSGTNNDHGYNWTLEEVKTLPVDITSAGYATFYSPVALTVPETDDMNVYVAEKQDDCLKLTKVDAISANQGVILRGEAGTYNFTIEGEGNNEESELSGHVASATSADGDYVLSIGTIGGKENQVGFFPARSGEVLKGFKSYLENAHTAGVAAFRFSFEELTTAIDAANDTMQEEVVYNLNGQRVKKAHGLVIVNGKKVMVK